MMIPASGKRYTRTKYARGAALYVGAVPAFLCLMVLAALIRERSSGVRHGEVAIGTWAAAFCVLVAVAARFTRLAIIATPRRLTVRNFWSTRRVPWQEIEKIEPPRVLKIRPAAMYGQTGAGLRITLRGGRVILANAYARRSDDPANFADAVVHELRQAVKIFRNGPSAN